MAFFKFRKSGDDQTATASPPESIEALRKRARHRLIGTTILVLLGVIGFPLLVDKQPRPVAVDIPIEIPDRNKVKPLLAVPPPPPAQTEAAAPPPVVQAEPRPQAPPEVKPQAVADDKSAGQAVEQFVEKPAEKPLVKPVEKKPVDSGAKAQALLDGKAPSAEPPAAAGRFVVQVGAFAEAPKAREVRLKVERAGLKTYTHVAETKDGQRIRVRVGPFATRAEAEKAVEKIKKLDLPAIILTL